MASKLQQRVFISIFFFISGFSFATWASRIPTIKEIFGFNEAELGTILLAMPISSFVGLPISGWLVAKFDSRIPLASAYILHAISLSVIGFATTPFMLIAGICLLAFSTRIFNISVNTQAIAFQKQIENKITGSFHGLWSTGGIFGVAFSTAMVALDVAVKDHFLIVSVLCVIVTAVSFPFLLAKDRSATGNKLIIGKPDPYIMHLGLLVFFAAICEGGMFDWSGIYFKDILDQPVFTYGYLSFMVFMALSRFLSDPLTQRFGFKAVYLMSAILISVGIILAIAFPFVWTALIGFSFVGFGVAPIVPISYTLAGFSKKYSPGMAISIIATYAIVGMLLGPPIIGYLAHAFNLRVSFIVFAIVGLLIIPVSWRFFKLPSNELKG